MTVDNFPVTRDNDIDMVKDRVVAATTQRLTSMISVDHQ